MQKCEKVDAGCPGNGSEVISKRWWKSMSCARQAGTSVLRKIRKSGGLKERRRRRRKGWRDKEICRGVENIFFSVLKACSNVFSFGIGHVSFVTALVSWINSAPSLAPALLPSWVQKGENKILWDKSVFLTELWLTCLLQVVWRQTVIWHSDDLED